MGADTPVEGAGPVFTLRVECGNNAFQPDPHAEVARLLRRAADALERGGFQTPYALHDANGNRVGSAYLTSLSSVAAADRVGFVAQLPAALLEQAAASGRDLQVLVRRWETGTVECDTRPASNGPGAVWEPVGLHGGSEGWEVEV